MVSENKIDAREAARLLGALNDASPEADEAGAARSGAARWFRVRVTDLATGRVKVNVNLPLSLVRVGLRMGAHFAPEVQELDWDELMVAIQEGAAGKLVEVEDMEDGEKVEVYVE
jgi:hypothetical protein